ncbi:hypothetical protein CAPTEDRAFT_227014 [Capitella teleta]|uniref:Uncharacterized protein n=1 Tax=Capitella teleta TaxID=283909 RepID=R7TKZ4_CAPTE|nr:hypothetical protein CAPTEDRAFT_227014 [Capitella teleta]|eukprot:ELT94508.1 hypothetical protein CAPTEDRAFT_227014 [Capitella teleta]
MASEGPAKGLIVDKVLLCGERGPRDQTEAAVTVVEGDQPTEGQLLTGEEPLPASAQLCRRIRTEVKLGISKVILYTVAMENKRPHPDDFEEPAAKRLRLHEPSPAELRRLLGSLYGRIERVAAQPTEARGRRRWAEAPLRVLQVLRSAGAVRQHLIGAVRATDPAQLSSRWQRFFAGQGLAFSWLVALYDCQGSFRLATSPAFFAEKDFVHDASPRGVLDGLRAIDDIDCAVDHQQDIADFFGLDLS